MKADAEIVDLVDDMSVTIDCVLEVKEIRNKINQLEYIITQILLQILVSTINFLCFRFNNVFGQRE